MKKSKGKIIRVSLDVYESLERKKKSFRSWDALMRCLLGLSPRKGSFRKLQEYWIVYGSPKLFDKLSEAKGEAIKVAVKNSAPAVVPPTKVREVL